MSEFGRVISTNSTASSKGGGKVPVEGMDSGLNSVGDQKDELQRTWSWEKKPRSSVPRRAGPKFISSLFVGPCLLCQAKCEG